MFGGGTNSWRIACVLLAVGIEVSDRALSQTTPFARGDVFVATGNQVFRYSSNGRLLQKINTGATENDGMAFDSSGNLYVTNFNDQTVTKVGTTGVRLGTFGGGYVGLPESIVFDRSGNAYVGQANDSFFGGPAPILKFGPNGNLLASYSAPFEDRGTDWIDLAADQRTMFYTSEGTRIKRFDVVGNNALADFANVCSRRKYSVRSQFGSRRVFLLDG